MNQQDFNNAYILLLSGAAELKGKSVKWKDQNDRDVYIEFPDLTPTHAIVRKYWNNGKLWQECNWIKNVKHGKELRWHENGKLHLECNWVKGLLHGKELNWYENGKLYRECNWANGVKHGKELCWHIYNEILSWEYEWFNGKIII